MSLTSLQPASSISFSQNASIAWQTFGISCSNCMVTSVGRCPSGWAYILQWVRGEAWLHRARVSTRFKTECNCILDASVHGEICSPHLPYIGLCDIAVLPMPSRCSTIQSAISCQTRFRICCCISQCTVTFIASTFRCLRHELSSARTLRSWVRIPLEACMALCVHPVL
jgi:hypothetical protein